MFVNLNRLRIFATVVRHNSITKAASFLNTTQSNITNHMKALEHEIGEVLCFRTSRGFSLTKTGQELYEISNKILLEIDSFQIPHRSSKLEIEGKINIACTSAFNLYFILRNIEKFNSIYPKVTFNLITNIEEMEHIRKEEADILISSKYIDTPPGIENQLLCQYYGYPYASKAYIEKVGVIKSVNDLDRHRLICIRIYNYPFLKEREVNWLLYAGLQGKEKRIPFITVGDDARIIEAVASGLGIGIVPDYIAETKDNVQKISDSWYEPTQSHIFKKYIIYSKRMKKVPRVKAFIDFLFKKVLETDSFF